MSSTQAGGSGWRRRARRRAAVAVCALALLPGALAQSPDPAPVPAGYVMGIVPYFSPSRLEDIFAPAAAELARSVQRPVHFRTASTWERFFAQMKAQTYDIVFVHALYYVAAADEFGYVPLARMREPFTAVVVVPEASPIHHVDELRGKKIAMPPSFLPAVHLARKTLRDRGLVRGQTITLEETRTVDACLQQALIGAVQACIAPPFAAQAYQASTGARLRVVLETSSLPSPVFAVHRRVPEAERERLRAAFLAWNDSAIGQAVLRSINTRALVPAHDGEYDIVRRFVRDLDEPWRPSVP